MPTFVVSAALGAIFGLCGPAKPILAASAEVIAFVTLIMAGLLPAMILTATALRGDAFSATRVRELGIRLRAQLQFWAMLFLFALIAVLGVCAAKMSNDSSSIVTSLGKWNITYSTANFTTAALMLGYSALAVVLARLYPAYRGLCSLLDLTITTAEAQALSNDRTLADTLNAKAERIGSTSDQRARSAWPS